MQNYPLLIKGYDLPDVAVGATISGQFIFDKQRGDVVALDALPLEQVISISDTNITLQVGGINIVENAILSQLAYNANPRTSRLVEGCYGGGQTIQYTLANPNAFVAVSSMFHAYYENPFNNPEHLALFQAGQANLKFKDYVINSIAGAKSVTNAFDLPKNQGRIIGVKILVTDTSSASAYLSRLSLRVNGTLVIENAGAILGFSDCAKPYLIMPIEIERASSIEVIFDNNGAQDLPFGVRFYFAPNT